MTSPEQTKAQPSSDPAAMEQHEILTHFAWRMAHDLNNLLMAITGNTQLARRRLDKPEDLIRHLDKIDVASDRIEEISRKLLNFAGKGLDEKIQIDIAKTTQSVIDRAKKRSNTICSVVTENNLPIYLGSPERMQRIITNLVNNAIEALPLGGAVTIDICCRHLGAVDFANHLTGLPMEDGEYFQLSVTTSVDAPEADICRKMFWPGYSSKTSGRGRGLGLNETLGLTTSMGGGMQSEINDKGQLKITAFWPKN